MAILHTQTNGLVSLAPHPGRARQEIRRHPLPVLRTAPDLHRAAGAQIRRGQSRAGLIQWNSVRRSRVLSLFHIHRYSLNFPFPGHHLTPKRDQESLSPQTQPQALPPKRKRSWAAIAASLLILLSTAGLIAFLAVERNLVARSVPGAAGLYAAIGMPTNPHGLALRNVKVDWVEEDNQTELEVRGEVHNLLTA